MIEEKDSYSFDDFVEFLSEDSCRGRSARLCLFVLCGVIGLVKSLIDLGVIDDGDDKE